MSNIKVVGLKNVSIFQQDNLVLKDIDLSIQKGEFVYLIGKTGSGKSSLLKTIYAALPLKKGSGFAAGYDLTKLNRKTIPLLRRKLGIIFQDFTLLHDRTVFDNLLFVLKATGWKKRKDIEVRIANTLAQVGLSIKRSKMPHELSGGEQQRLVIARALINKPQLVIADEPTGNLDPETSDGIMKLLQELSKENNTAVLFATHDYRIIQDFPARIIRCVKGKVIEEENFVV
jgi:cell division transport system ATP-binding protein